MTLLLIGAGGAAGAMARYLVDAWVVANVAGRFPWGIFVVNVSGSFLVGLLFALSAGRQVLPESIRPPLLIGFLGAYTTFSTLSLDSWRLVEEGNYLLAAGNVVGSVVLGLVAVVAGLAVGRLVAG